jgi:hypothetical protein
MAGVATRSGGNWAWQQRDASCVLPLTCPPPRPRLRLRLPRRAAAQAAAAAAAEERSALAEEKTLLKTVLGAALGQKEAAEERLAALGASHAELLRERTNLHNQVRTAHARACCAPAPLTACCRPMALPRAG